MLQKWCIRRICGILKKRTTVNHFTTLLSLKDEPVYKYSCIVPNKNENLLMLESIYNEEFNHVFSDGHIEIESNLLYLYKLLLCSRTIEQIRLQIHNSFCAYENVFINIVKNINWSVYIPFSSVFVAPHINVQCVKSRLYHTCMIKNILLNTLQRQQQLYIEKHGDENILLKKKKLNPSKLKPAKINVLFRYNECKISINASTDLNKRIYEFSKSENSLKATIVAAAVLKVHLLEYVNPSYDLFIIDPFCNDGTIILEILSVLLSIPNGSPSINYPIVNFPLHSPSTFFNVLNDLTLEKNENLNRVFLLGIDEDQRNIITAKTNWKRFFNTMPLQVSENVEENQNDTFKNIINDTNVSTLNNIKRYNVLSKNQLNELFNTGREKNINENNKDSSIKTFVLNHVKFCPINSLCLNKIIENCIVFTNVINLDKKKIQKFEKLILRSDIVATYVFAKEKYKEHTSLKFRLILRFVSKGQNIIFLQLFNKRKKNIYTDEEEIET